MYENENGEYVEIRHRTDENGDFKEIRTYQNNGWIRINREYADCTTEEYTKECDEQFEQNNQCEGYLYN